MTLAEKLKEARKNMCFKASNYKMGNRGLRYNSDKLKKAF